MLTFISTDHSAETGSKSVINNTKNEPVVGQEFSP